MTCAWCSQVFFLCRWCDDGDRYCTRSCAATARRESLRAAGLRYQQTEAGRAHHAARQQRYLERREAAKMTHQTAQKLPERVEVLAPPPASTHDAPTASGEEDVDAIALGRNRFEAPRDTDPRDDGADGDDLEGSAIAIGGAPRALPTLLEALALWQGIPVRAALVVDDVDGSSATRLGLDSWAGIGGSPLYEVEFAPRRKPHHRDSLDGMGVFHGRVSIVV